MHLQKQHQKIIIVITAIENNLPQKEEPKEKSWAISISSQLPAVLTPTIIPVVSKIIHIILIKNNLNLLRFKISVIREKSCRFMFFIVISYMYADIII